MIASVTVAILTGIAGIATLFDGFNSNSKPSGAKIIAGFCLLGVMGFSIYLALSQADKDDGHPKQQIAITDSSKNRINSSSNDYKKDVNRIRDSIAQSLYNASKKYKSISRIDTIVRYIIDSGRRNLPLTIDAKMQFDSSECSTFLAYVNRFKEFNNITTNRAGIFTSPESNAKSILPEIEKFITKRGFEIVTRGEFTTGKLSFKGYAVSYENDYIKLIVGSF